MITKRIGVAAAAVALGLTVGALPTFAQQPGETKVVKGPVSITREGSRWHVHYVNYTYQYSPKQQILNNWLAQNANNRISWYAQEGEEAFQLARDLEAAGIDTGGPQMTWQEAYAHGWPMEAATIHDGVFPGSEAAFLDAWNVVSGNVAAHGWGLGDPLVLDLNGNGKIDVTGRSTAKYRAKGDNAFVAAGSVLFDLLGTGTPIRTEWASAGDGFLVDNREGKALKKLAKGQQLSITELFGDADGHTGGFAKLASEFIEGNRIADSMGVVPQYKGVLKGAALDNLLVWIDNGDGKATAQELHSLSSLGITEIRLPPHFIQKPNGEILEQATFVRNGKPQLMQEVWFAHEEKQP